MCLLYIEHFENGAQKNEPHASNLTITLNTMHNLGSIFTQGQVLQFAVRVMSVEPWYELRRSDDHNTTRSRDKSILRGNVKSKRPRSRHIAAMWQRIF